MSDLKKRYNKYFVALGLLVLLSACNTVSKKSTSYDDQFINSGIRSILVVPIVNKSVDIDAPTSVLSSLPALLAGRGYYVFGVNTTKVVLEHEGFNEAGEIHQLSPITLAETFGADCIFYVSIEKWTTEYILVSSTTRIDLRYKMVDRLGATIWSAKKTLNYSSRTHDTGDLWVDLLTNAVNAALEKAKPRYMNLTRKANNQVLLEDATRLPDGPYLVRAKELGN